MSEIFSEVVCVILKAALKFIRNHLKLDGIMLKQNSGSKKSIGILCICIVYMYNV